MNILLSSIQSLWNTSPTFFVGFAAFLVASLSLRANTRATKVKNSIDFESSYKHKESIKNSSDHVLKLVTNPQISSEQLFTIAISADRTKKDNDYCHINDFLNEWERCANGVYYGVYDEKFLYGTYATTVIETFKYLLPFILMRQGDKRDRVYIKFSWLALNWMIRRDKENKKKTEQPYINALRYLEHHHRSTYTKKHIRLFFRIVGELAIYPSPVDCLKKTRLELLGSIKPTATHHRQKSILGSAISRVGYVVASFHH